MNYDADTGIVQLDFHRAMDTTHLPAASDFMIIQDGSPESPLTPNSCVWYSGSRLNLAADPYLAEPLRLIWNPAAAYIYSATGYMLPAFNIAQEP